MTLKRVKRDSVDEILGSFMRIGSGFVMLKSHPVTWFSLGANRRTAYIVGIMKGAVQVLFED